MVVICARAGVVNPGAGSHPPLDASAAVFTPPILDLPAQYHAGLEHCTKMLSSKNARQVNSAASALWSLRQRLAPKAYYEVDGLLAGVAVREKRADLIDLFTAPYLPRNWNPRNWNPRNWNPRNWQPGSAAASSATSRDCPRSEGAVPYHTKLCPLYLARAEADLLRRQPAAAAALCDWVIQNEEKREVWAEPTVSQAAEVAGRAFLDLKDYAQAKYAFQYGQAWFAAHFPDDEARQFNTDLLAALAGGLRQAQRQLDIQRYGQACVRFRDAEAIRLSDRPVALALPIYAEVIRGWPDTPYAEASRFFGPMCLLRQGRVAQAERALQAFYDAKPKGLYRGEALLELGRIAVERHGDFDLAEKRFEELDQWLTDIRAPGGDPEPDTLDIVQAAWEVVTPPAQRTHKDYFGNTIKNNLQPGQLFNRKTSRWYLNHLEEQCAKFRGFLELARGTPGQPCPAALEQFNRLPALNPELRDTPLGVDPNDFNRLKFGAEHGWLIARPAELQVYPPRLKQIVLLVDFYMAVQDYPHATDLCDRLLRGDFSRLSSAQEDYLHYALGDALYHGKWTPGGNSVQLACAQWERILARHDHTWTMFRAAYAIGHLSMYVKNKVLRQRGELLLAQLAACPEANPFTVKARLLVGRRWCDHGQYARGLAMLRSITPDQSAACAYLAQRDIAFYSQRMLQRGGHP